MVSLMFTEKFKLFYSILIAVIFVNINLTAQDLSDSTDKSISYFVYPYLFYTPETNLAFGAGGVLSFHLSDSPKSSSSNITASGYYTINGQYDINLIPDFYFSNDQFRAYLKINYRKIFDKFYGIGNSTIDNGNESYAMKNLGYLLKLLTGISDFVKVGLVMDYTHNTIIDKKSNPYLLSDTIKGSDGGVTNGLGLIVTRDTRDNMNFPSEGGYYEFSFSFYTKNLGSNYDFNKYIFDFRRYAEIFHKNYLALQVYGEHLFGDPPFFKLAALGGDRLMRGYYKGRYRDKAYITGQFEYRRELWLRIGLVGFIGTGEVAHDYSLLEMKKLLLSYGVGLRYRFDLIKKLDIRMDIGFGKNTSGIYFSANQAF
jgi:outer membrane protein assembly factor BamA